MIKALHHLVPIFLSKCTLEPSALLNFYANCASTIPWINCFNIPSQHCSMHGTPPTMCIHIDTHTHTQTHRHALHQLEGSFPKPLSLYTCVPLSTHTAISSDYIMYLTLLWLSANNKDDRNVWTLARYQALCSMLYRLTRLILSTTLRVGYCYKRGN